MSFVYKFVDYEDKIIYIGKTNNLEKRMQQHFNGLGHLPLDCYNSVNKIFFIKVDGKTNVDMYETFLINKYVPIYNTDKQFREILKLHNNDFIKIEEIEWNELFFRFGKNGIETSKTKFSYDFFNNNYGLYDKCLSLLCFNYYQLKHRQGLYQHYIPSIIKDNQQLLEFLTIFHNELICNRNFNTNYSCFDEPINEENDAFEYVAIDIDKIKNINLEILLMLVQAKMLVRITNKLYGVVAHTPYALNKFEQNYFFNEYES